MHTTWQHEVLFLDQSRGPGNPPPTPKELDGSYVLIHESSGCRLVRVQRKFLIKFGINVDPIEGHNMLYVANSTTVPVQMYNLATWQKKKKKKDYLQLSTLYYPLQPRRRNPRCHLLSAWKDDNPRLHPSDDWR